MGRGGSYNVSSESLHGKPGCCFLRDLVDGNAGNVLAFRGFTFAKVKQEKPSTKTAKPQACAPQACDAAIPKNHRSGGRTLWLRDVSVRELQATKASSSAMVPL